MTAAQQKGHARSELTRQRLLDAGFTLFSQKGLNGTNSREIAAAAGVSIGSFYTYFKDKRQLFIALIRSIRGKLLEILDGYLAQGMLEKDLTETVHQLTQLIWNSYAPVYQLDRQAEMLREIDPQIDAIIKGQQAEVFQRIQMLIRMTAPKLRVKDLEAAAWVVVHIIRGAVFAVRNPAPPIDGERIMDALADAVARYLFE